MNYKDDDIVVSSRVRLARNLADTPFLPGMKKADADSVIARAAEAAPELMLVKAGELSPIERQVLVERHLASPDWAAGEHGGLLFSKDERIAIMLVEEDHLRIQSILPGNALPGCDEETKKLSDGLSQKLHFAYDERYGYLTACPTNVGTGMRASVLMHLPCLAITGRARQLFQMLAKMGYAVRGEYGEGTDSHGGYVQISNQVTLGISEEEIVSGMSNTVEKILEKERSARFALVESRRVEIEDIVYRALGVLQNSRRLSAEELTQLLSRVKLGAAIGWLKYPQTELNELSVRVQPALLQKQQGREVAAEERDYLRANAVRETLGALG